MPELTIKSFKDWAARHDESVLFIASYVGLAVVLSLWISLFWLVAVVFVHFLFEIIRQSRHHRGAGRIAVEALWEVKLDIALVIGALVLALYIDLIFGILGLRSVGQMGMAAKSGAQIGVRFGVWEQVLRGFFLTVDDAVHVGRSFFMKKGAKARSGKASARDSSPLKPAGWTVGDVITLSLLFLFLVLIPLAPVITDHSWEDSLGLLAAELDPFPAGGEEEAGAADQLSPPSP